MTLHFIPSQSTQMPELLDTTSSATTVFIRKDVEEKTREPMTEGGQPEIYYEYQEAQLSRYEYQMYVNEQLTKENADLRDQIQEQAEALMELAGIMTTALSAE